MKYTLVLTLVMLLSACAGRPQAESKADKPCIMVSIEPLRYFTEAVAGEQFRVISLVPIGNSPESYDPTPRQLMELAQSKAYIGIPYLGFEQAWSKQLRENAPDTHFTDVTTGIDLIRSAAPEHTHTTDAHREHHHHHHAVEPHVWSSPYEAQAIVRNITNTLIELDPTHKADYRERSDSLLRTLDELDRQFAKQLQSGKSYIIYHPTLSYLARRYGLRQLCIEQEGREPTPTHLTGLIETGRHDKVKTLFIQPQFPREHARVIADEIVAQVVEINPLAYEWEKEMRKTVEALTENHEETTD